MPDYKPNQFIRALAVLALVAAFIAVVAVVITSEGSSDGGDGNGARAKTERPNKRGREALDRGVWIVRSGDTLGKISEETGMDVDTLIELNPDLDPQALLEGQRIDLR
ncbi:MAG TPA: LysM domain-containing protein [Solirubrobacterales bacterium]|nr:LysM domain-containing protein [Solirubrobacterales bacterium]